MKKAIIFGTEQFGEILYHYLKDEKKYEICGFVVDSKYKDKDTFYNLPVVEFEKAHEIFNPDVYGMFICLGYVQMNKIRELKFKEAKDKGYEILSYYHPSAIVLSENIGEGNIIMEGSVIGPFCEIGDGNVFWPKSHIAHHTKIQNFNFFTISVAVAGNIIIGNNCFFGNNCTIKNGIEIRDKTLIGAGCYISKSTEEEGVYVPQRSIKLENKSSLNISL